MKSGGKRCSDFNNAIEGIKRIKMIKKQSFITILLVTFIFNYANVFGLHFEVIHATNAILKESQSPVAALERLSEDDVMVLKDGYLLLLNSMGEFYEFEGDKVISFKLLSEQVDYQGGQLVSFTH